MDQEIQHSIDKLLSSKDFRDSSVYRNLLSYLIAATREKKTPKEVTIAIDVFAKAPTFNVNKDSTVRYHMHQLRNKLDNYYQNEGKDDRIRLNIPKGHYEVEFVSPRVRRRKWFHIVGKVARWEVAVILLLGLTNLFFIQRLFLSGRPPALGPAPVSYQDRIWGSFFSNGFPVSIILGDDFFIDEYVPGLDRYRQIRDWQIDSQDDLHNFLLLHPDYRMWKSEITGIPFGGLDNLMDLFPVIYPLQKKISVRLSSMITLDEIQNHNIIYIGEFKNLRVLDKILYKTPVRYQYHPDERVFILGDRGDTLNAYLRIQAPYAQKDKYNVDYSLLIKIPGIQGENLMFIVGFGYAGRLERSKMLGNEELRNGLIREILQRQSNIPEYFIAVFEVRSIERTGFANELKYFQEIAADFFK